VKKLEDIPKKNIFEVPEGYFEKLPGVIQSRVADERPQVEIPFYVPVLRYAVAAVMLVSVSVFFYQTYFSDSNAELMLASVSTEALTEYLDESETSTEELLETVGYENIDTEGLDANPVMEFNLNELELEDLAEEYQNEL